MRRSIEAVTAILLKDFLVDVRRVAEVGTILVFVAAAAVLNAFIMRAGFAPEIVVTGVHLLILFVSVYVALSTFIREADRGTLDSLRIAPLPPVLVFIAKFVYSFLLLIASMIAYLALLAFFSNTFIVLDLMFLLHVIVECIYASAVSSLSSIILVFSEARSLLLPVTILVLMLPYMQMLTVPMMGALQGVASLSTLIYLGVASVAFAAFVSWLSQFALEAI